MEAIRSHSKIEYKESENETIFTVKVSDLKDIKNYAVMFNSMENQLTYYNSQGFYCEKTSYE